MIKPTSDNLARPLGLSWPNYGGLLKDDAIAAASNVRSHSLR